MNAPLSPRAQRFLLFALAAVQLTVVLDFLIIMPLGPQYQRVFDISQQQFDVIVSAYALAAGISGIFMGIFIDRFDRRKALFVLFAGFLLGTLACGLAPTYWTLVIARAATGVFGGVLGGLIFVVVGDTVSEAHRGKAMGIIMSSFSLATIAGVPAGLFLAEQFSWHIPFFCIVGIGALVFPVLALAMPPIRGHIERVQMHHPLKRWWMLISHPTHLKAFLFIGVVVFAGFCIFPNISSYMTFNIGLDPKKQLFWVYVCGGLATFFSMNWIGHWSDKVGKPKAFVIVSLSAIVPVLVLTRLPSLDWLGQHVPENLRFLTFIPMLAVLCVSTVFMIVMSGRMAPAMAMMTSTVEPRMRGGFMSMTSSVQQFVSGLAAYVSGLIIHQQPKSPLIGFDTVGWISVGCIVLAVVLAMQFRKQKTEAVVSISH